ncbi:MAG: coniferyl aldehyde dehydrogenase [Pseudoruegeria sp.]
MPRDPFKPRPAPTLADRFAILKASHRADPYPTYQARWNRLDRLEIALLVFSERLIQAISADFSYRNATESQIFDITATLGEIHHAKHRLKKWMKARKVSMPLHLRPASGRIMPQPLGVVGIIAPWNFPILLAISPMASALAAGNRVMLKPSELSPQTSEVLEDMISAHFSPDEIAIETGGPEVAKAFSDLPFDHLFFTGSTEVGRLVAQAAAKNLTPVTLELGGKSPAILTPSADLKRAAKRIAWGKTASAGQACVAPDYVLLPRAQLDEFADKLRAAMVALYPTGANSPDYSAIITKRHYDRLVNMVATATNAGVKTISLDHANSIKAHRKFAPTILIDPPLDLQVMQDEVFGPIISLIPYDTQDDAIQFVAKRDHPLALYVFAEDRSDQDLWLKQSLSGGASMNEVVVHVGCSTLPFGGVGASGIGACHGERGFETFSHMKSVLVQPKLNGAGLIAPPFTGTKKKIVRLIQRFV